MLIIQQYMLIIQQYRISLFKVLLIDMYHIHLYTITFSLMFYQTCNCKHTFSITHTHTHTNACTHDTYTHIQTEITYICMDTHKSYTLAYNQYTHIEHQAASYAMWAPKGRESSDHNRGGGPLSRAAMLVCVCVYICMQYCVYVCLCEGQLRFWLGVVCVCVCVGGLACY